MAVLAFLSCANGSYTTPNVGGLLDKKRKTCSQLLHQKVGRAKSKLALTRTPSGGPTST
jgi:hypothetical protein